ncbi:Protein CBG26963 [Caenorhabditis briggsae]|uniref:Protein CBG26963 n=1 Tax=Caenorhabditis briggsae TaxID=6238 RepID=B6IES9_CAEBR|nr:Protein CBG26963 [Caenorhabditis briggsae]CAR98409.1 Protein CBG26963 [Caenorhabditis briggsae]
MTEKKKKPRLKRKKENKIDRMVRGKRRLESKRISQ